MHAQFQMHVMKYLFLCWSILSLKNKPAVYRTLMKLFSMKQVTSEPDYS